MLIISQVGDTVQVQFADTDMRDNDIALVRWFDWGQYFTANIVDSQIRA